MALRAPASLRSSPARALAAALVVLGGSAALAGPPPDRGRVRDTTPRRAFLDVGRAAGLKLGDAVELWRGGRTVGRCVIDQIADHAASCPIEARVGDTLALPQLPPSEERASPGERPAPPAPLTEDERARLAGPFDKVDYRGASTSLGARLGLLRAELGHAVWVSLPDRTFQTTRIDLALDGLNLRFGGMRAYAHLSALLHEQQPAERRFRAGDKAQLYVWDLQASSREVGRPFVLSVGRILPYHAPGLTIVDGAQVGWRSRDGAAEVGALGGTVPAAMTLYPSARWIGGLYYGVSHAAKRAFFPLVRHEARLSARDTAIGRRVELEALAQAWVHRYVDVGASARGVADLADPTHPRLEAARASLGIHPSSSVRALASFRYLDARTDDPDALAASLLSRGRWLYAEGDVAWTPRSWLSLSAHGGVAHEGEAAAARQYLGGEVGFPRLFRSLGGLSLGYREEFGWLAGRTAHAAAHLTFDERVRLLLRGSYFEDGLPAATLREAGAWLMVDGRLWRWLSLRASALGRVQLAPRAEEQAPPWGVVARLDVVGAW